MQSKMEGTRRRRVLTSPRAVLPRRSGFIENGHVDGARAAAPSIPLLHQIPHHRQIEPPQHLRRLLDELLHLRAARLHPGAVVELRTAPDGHRPHVGNYQFGDCPRRERQPGRRLPRHGPPDQPGADDREHLLQNASLVVEIPVERRGQLVEHHHLVLGQDDEIGPSRRDIADDGHQRRNVRHERELRVGHRRLIDDLLGRDRAESGESTPEGGSAIRVALQNLHPQVIDGVSIVGTNPLEAHDRRRRRLEPHRLRDSGPRAPPPRIPDDRRVDPSRRVERIVNRAHDRRELTVRSDDRLRQASRGVRGRPDHQQPGRQLRLFTQLIEAHFAQDIHHAAHRVQRAQALHRVTSAPECAPNESGEGITALTV